MKVDFTIEIENLEGMPIPITEMNESGKEKKTGKNVTLKSVSVNALYSMLEDEKKLSGEDKVKRHIIAEKIYKSTGAIDIKAKEIVLLKELIGKIYSPLIVARSYELLEKEEEDGTNQPDSTEKEDS